MTAVLVRTLWAPLGAMQVEWSDRSWCIDISASMRSIRRLATIAQAGLTSAGRVEASPSHSADLHQHIESERTRAVHESRAAHLTKEAADACTVAMVHSWMALSYQGTGGCIGKSMSSHCSAIAPTQEPLAARYQAMAAAHRECAGPAQS